MPTERPYSRVYWSVLDDAKFETILPNERHLGTWTKLLIVADMAWPAPAYLPPVPRASVRALVSVGLVDLLTDGRYRVHGLDAERSRRSASASVGASARWSDRSPNAVRPQSKRIPTASDSEMPRREEDETRRDETSTAPANGVDDPAVAFQERTGEFPGGRMLPWLDELGEAHGEVRLAAAIRSTPMTSRNSADYLRTVRDKLRAEDHAAEQAERAEEKRRIAVRRAAPAPQRISDTPEYRAILAEISKPVTS